MAVGDFERFSPAESLYTKPGAADERARQGVLKRAAYLSQMDMFYEELEESQRQFNETYKLQERSADLAEKEFADVSAFRREELATKTETERRGQDVNAKYYRQQYELGLGKLGVDYRGQTLGYKAEREKASPGSTSVLGHPDPFEHTSDIRAREEQRLRETVLGGR